MHWWSRFCNENIEDCKSQICAASLCPLNIFHSTKCTRIKTCLVKHWNGWFSCRCCRESATSWAGSANSLANTWSRSWRGSARIRDGGWDPWTSRLDAAPSVLHCPKCLVLFKDVIYNELLKKTHIAVLLSRPAATVWGGRHKICLWI